MDCGTNDLVCQGMTWLSENEFVAATMTELVSHLGAGVAGAIGKIASFIEHNAQAIVGVGGLAFGVWRWWRYREQILHRRLAEYLRESDGRLKDGEHYVLKALQRPGPGQPFELPLFAPSTLRSILRERFWDREPVALCVETSAELQLSKAIDKIGRQMKTAQDEMRSLRQQFATAHILHGAISSSLASRSPRLIGELSASALRSFRTALETEGYQNDIVAKEMEAHQLRKMGHLQEALQAYVELEALAATVEDKSDRIRLTARTKRYRAEILQALNTEKGPSGETVYLKTMPAYFLVSGNIAGSAIDIRDKLKPFQGWDLIEHADICYLAAFISKNLNFNLVMQQHLAVAKTAYADVLAAASHRRWWQWDRRRRLKSAARAGIERVERAEEGIYDTAWLTPPLKKPN
jgi:hypothetical protein